MREAAGNFAIFFLPQAQAQSRRLGLEVCRI